MEIKELDGHILKQWMYFGHQEVLKHKTYINAINVFPVADGDTGTNFTTTLKAMSEKSVSSNSFSEAAKSISRSGLAHARGNSGMIFVSYFNGLATECSGLDIVNMTDFAKMAKDAVIYTYQSVEKPIEGTMITVIRDWADFLATHATRYDSFNALFEDAYGFAEKSLEKTTSMMEVLRKNKVVDAGAACFVGFLKGINTFMKGGVTAELKTLEFPSLPDIEEEDTRFRYCTEALIEGALISPQALKPLLKSLGDSLMVTRIGDILRIHIHTDHPDALFHKVKDFGVIAEQKVDDMALQKLVRSHKNSEIAVLTDSIADLPDALKLEYQIHTLPLSILVDDVDYLDKQTISLENVFEAMKTHRVYPQSSLPALGRIEEKLQFLLEHYGKILVITVSSQLSATHYAILKAASQLDPSGERITVVDSLTNSGAQGLLVWKAAQLNAQGATFDEITQALSTAIPKTKIYVCLDTIQYAIKSGRVPRTLGKLAMLLGARPIMTVGPEGKGSAFGVGFSKTQMTAKILKLIKSIQNTKGIEAYSIVHAGNPTLAQYYQTILTEQIGRAPEFVTEISSITAIHSGIGTVAVSITEK